MTITYLSPVNSYLGDGVQTVFPVFFPIFGDGRHVRAVISTGSGGGLVERQLVYGLDYSVRDLTGGGECVTAAPVPDGCVLTLYLDLPHVQVRDFDNQGRLDAEQIELGMDYITALTAQNAAILNRAVKIPISSDQTPEEFVSGIFSVRDDAAASAEEAASRREEARACASRACECAGIAEAAALRSEEAAAGADAARSEAKNFAEQASAVPMPRGIIAMWSGASGQIPGGWLLCDGENGTPDLRDRFIIGAGGGYAVGELGGSDTVAFSGETSSSVASGLVGNTTLTAAQMPSHNHGTRGRGYGGGSSGAACSDGEPSLLAANPYMRTQNTGSSGSHAHSFTGAAHSHTFEGMDLEYIPPYYALAFIMKT